jgi:hypothetical protein
MAANYNKCKLFIITLIKVKNMIFNNKEQKLFDNFYAEFTEMGL